MTVPAWYIKDRGFLTADGSFATRRKSHHAFIWPNDRRRGRCGRLTDILTGKGADMFVSSNPNRTPNAADGPSKWRWNGFPAADTYQGQLADAASWLGNMPWTNSRERRRFYDFKTRRYRARPYDGMWADASYMPNSKTPAYVTMYPHLREPIRVGPARDAIYDSHYDPRNFGSNGVAYGHDDYGGGYWPPVDGYP